MTRPPMPPHLAGTTRRLTTHHGGMWSINVSIGADGTATIIRTADTRERMRRIFATIDPYDGTMAEDDPAILTAVGEAMRVYNRESR